MSGHETRLEAQGASRKDALLRAGLALSSDLSLPAVLGRIVRTAADITGARYGALGVLGSDGRIAEFVTVGIDEETRRAIGHYPTGGGVLGALIEDARPLRLANISDDPRSVGFPPNHPPMHSFLGAPVEALGRVYGNIYLAEKQGAAEFTDEDEEDLVVLATQAGVAVANAHLYEETRRRERWLDAAGEITASILAGDPPSEVLTLAAARARELARADLATIAVRDADGSSFVNRAAAGDLTDELLGLLFPVEGSISGDAIRTREPQVLVDASADGRIDQPVVRLGTVGPAVVVPMTAQDQAFGTLTVANRAPGRAFSEDDIRVVASFAAQASIALEYGRAQDQLKRLVVMEDRERIAKELHDGVIQSLFAVGMGLQGTAMVVGDADIAARIETAVNELDRVIRDLRNYIFGLRPGILADRQLGEALRDLADDFAEKSGVTAVVDIDDRVAAELASKAADIVQVTREALSNVGRHAEAATCRVQLRFDDSGGAVLEIDDDGRGFDPAAAAPRGSGNGLTNLEHRAEALGGALEVQSESGEGTIVRVTIPL
jgi:signal transduction histidine kinase